MHPFVTSFPVFPVPCPLNPDIWVIYERAPVEFPMAIAMLA